MTCSSSKSKCRGSTAHHGQRHLDALSLATPDWLTKHVGNTSCLVCSCAAESTAPCYLVCFRCMFAARVEVFTSALLLVSASSSARSGTAQIRSIQLQISSDHSHNASWGIASLAASSCIALSSNQDGCVQSRWCLMTHSWPCNASWPSSYPFAGNNHFPISESNAVHICEMMRNSFLIHV